MSARLPLTDGANVLELVERNGYGLRPAQRALWMHEMTRLPVLQEEVTRPARLILELANTCNLDCPMCRIGEFGVDRSRLMPRELFDRIADEVFPMIREVRLNGLGEATLVPWFEECVERVVEAQLHGELITNLTCDAATMARLIEARFVILVSWDAASPTLFESLRRPSRWDEQYARLRTLSALGAERGVADHLHLLFTLQPSNVGELAGMVRLAREVGVPNLLVNVIKLQTEHWVERSLSRLQEAIAEARGLAMEHGVSLTLPDHVGSIDLKGPGVLQTASRSCDRPWNEVVIRWNGDVTVCNMFNPYTYGHFGRHGLARAWNGSLAQAFRRLVNGRDKHPYCDGCYYVHGVYEAARKSL